MSCYCDYDGAEFPDFYSVSTPTARREHRCCECMGVIQRGEQYERHSGKWDGRIEAFTTCRRCLDFEKNIAAHIPCFRRCAFGELISDAIECLQEYREEAGSLLFGAYRRDIIRRRNATALRQQRAA